MRRYRLYKNQDYLSTSLKEDLVEFMKKLRIILEFRLQKEVYLYLINFINHH